jgi:hypothetical protein
LWRCGNGIEEEHDKSAVTTEWLDAPDNIVGWNPVPQQSFH